MNLPPHNISVGNPHAPAPSMLYPASDIDWRFNSFMIVYMLECHSPKSSHPLPLSPKVRYTHLCLFSCLALEHHHYQLPVKTVQRREEPGDQKEEGWEWPWLVRQMQKESFTFRVVGVLVSYWCCSKPPKTNTLSSVLDVRNALSQLLAGCIPSQFCKVQSVSFTVPSSRGCPHPFDHSPFLHFQGQQCCPFKSLSLLSLIPSPHLLLWL